MLAGHSFCCLSGLWQMGDELCRPFRFRFWGLRTMNDECAFVADVTKTLGLGHKSKSKGACLENSSLFDSSHPDIHRCVLQESGRTCSTIALLPAPRISCPPFSRYGRAEVRERLGARPTLCGTSLVPSPRSENRRSSFPGGTGSLLC